MLPRIRRFKATQPKTRPLITRNHDFNVDTATFVRRALGKNYVEPNLEKTLPTTKLELKDFFVLKMVDTLKKKKGKEDSILTHPLVLVEDVEAFAAKIMAERGLDPAETDVIMGIDDGGGMLKVRISFYPVLMRESQNRCGHLVLPILTELQLNIAKS